MALSIGAEIKDNGKTKNFEIGQEDFIKAHRETPEQAKARKEREQQERNRR